MSTFYYNPTSSEDYSSQWTKYRQQSSHVHDLIISDRAFHKVLNEQFESIQDILSQSSQEQIAAIETSTNAVCGTLEDGFSLIDSQLEYMNSSLSDIRSELSNMSSMLNWNYSILIAEQKISNMLMGNIAQLLRIPDIQKERQYAVEQGLKFLKNAVYDEDFYDDSLTNLLKAESIEPTDYFILHHIGLIYLNSIKQLDIPKAEAYFRKAAKYAYVETLDNAAQTHDVLKLDTNQFFEGQNPTSRIKLQAAESFMYVARCNYIKGEMQEAVEYADKAYSMVDALLEAGYLKAKAYAAMNQMNESFQILDSIVDKNRFYMSKILSDKDFIGKNATTDFLVKKRNEAVEYAVNELDFFKQRINPLSYTIKIIQEVDELLSNDTYFAAMKALDKIGLSFNMDDENTITNLYNKEDMALNKAIDDIYNPIKREYDAKLLWIKNEIEKSSNKIKTNNNRIAELKEYLVNRRKNTRITTTENVINIVLTLGVALMIIVWLGFGFLGIAASIFAMIISYSMFTYLFDKLFSSLYIRFKVPDGVSDSTGAINQINLLIKENKVLPVEIIRKREELAKLVSTELKREDVERKINVGNLFAAIHG